MLLLTASNAESWPVSLQATLHNASLDILQRIAVSYNLPYVAVYPQTANDVPYMEWLIEQQKVP